MKRSATLGGGSPTLPAQQFAATISRQPWFTFVALLVVNAGLLALILYLERFHGIDHWNLVRDTNAIARQPAYFGFYSNTGAVAWFLPAPVALFAWLFLRQRIPGDGRLRVLCLGGLFVTVAGLDDLFMLHENSYAVGIPEGAVMVAYALFLLSFAACAIPVLHKTQWLLLLAALGALAFSFLFDLSLFPGSVLAEEVCKLAGISFLAAYLLTLSWSAMSDVFGRKTAGEIPRGRHGRP